MALRYWAMIVGLGLIWGTSFAAHAVLLREVGPMSVSLLRMGSGALFVWVFLIATRTDVRVPLDQLGLLILLAATNFAIPFSVFPIAQGQLASGIAGIMNGLTPVAVVIIAHFWPGGEKATLGKFIGVLIGFVGILFISLPAMTAGETSEFWALMFILLAPISYGVSLNFMYRIKRVEPFVMVGYTLGLSTLMLLPIALAMEGVPRMALTESWIWLTWVGFVGTGFAFLGLYWLVPRVGGTNMSTATFVAPVTAILLGVLFLKEQLEIAHLVGIAAILVAMLVIDGRILKIFGRAA